LSVLGPTKPEQWAPWGPTVTIERRPQPREGIVWPEIDEVMQRLMSLLEHARSGT
jgi:heptosyltransferase-2